MPELIKKEWRRAVQFGKGWRLVESGLRYRGVAGDNNDMLVTVGPYDIPEGNYRATLMITNLGDVPAWVSLGWRQGPPAVGLQRTGLHWPKKTQLAPVGAGKKEVVIEVPFEVSYKKGQNRVWVAILNRSPSVSAPLIINEVRLFSYRGEEKPAPPVVPNAPGPEPLYPLPIIPNIDWPDDLPTIGEDPDGDRVGLRAVAYKIGGERLTVLPDVTDISVTVPKNKTPTVSMSYPIGDLAPQSSLLAKEVEIGIEMSFTGETWVEIPGARVMSLQSQTDLKNDGTKGQSLTLVHVSSRLKEALVWDVPANAADKDGKYQFTAVNPGVILRTLWDAAVNRGWGEGLTLDCTPDVDAAGMPWLNVVTLAFDKFINLNQVVETLINLGIIDVMWDGRIMRVYNAEGVLSRDQSKRSRWFLHRDTTAAPEKFAWTDMVTDVLVKGEQGNTWRFHNDQAPKDLRRIEKVVEAGGISLEGTARLLSQPTLKAGTTPSEQITRSWSVYTSRLLPWRDYVPGDWLSVERAGGMEKLQVTQISVTRKSDGSIEGHTTFGTIIDSTIARLQRRQKGVVGGAAQAGSTVRPSDNRRQRKPAQVGQLAGNSTAVLNDAGYPTGIASLTWAPVSLDTHGAAINITAYEILYGKGADTSTWGIARTKSNSGDIYGIQCGTRYSFAVRAISSEGVPGDYSDFFFLDIASDLTPPPTPSAPTLSQNLGILSVVWDEKGSRGESMPLDYAALEISVQQPGRPPSMLQSLPTPLVRTAIAGLEIREWEVCLRTVDRSGNKSDWGKAATIKLESLIDTDAIDKQIKEHLAKSEVLIQKAREEALKQVQQLTGAMATVATSLVTSGPTPPDDGKEGSSMWVAPDGRIFVLRKKAGG